MLFWKRIVRDASTSCTFSSPSVKKEAMTIFRILSLKFSISFTQASEWLQCRTGYLLKRFQIALVNRLRWLITSWQFLLRYLEILRHMVSKCHKSDLTHLNEHVFFSGIGEASALLADFANTLHFRVFTPLFAKSLLALYKVALKSECRIYLFQNRSLYRTFE